MKKTLILLFVFLVFAFVITPKAKLLQITGRGNFNILEEGDMPAFENMYGTSILLSPTKLPLGIEVEGMWANTSEMVGNIHASSFGALGKILFELGQKPLNFLLSAGYGFYQGKYSFTTGNSTATIEEISSGIKAGISLRLFLSQNFLFSIGVGYRKLPVFTEAKELNFSGYGFSAGLGFSL